MQKVRSYDIHTHYRIMFFICALFIIIALFLDTPTDILNGYRIINFSRSVLVTDYIELGGIGAALVNSAISGLLFLVLLVLYRRPPDGPIIASLWITMGFSLFGKNFFNTLPILIGVMLYAKVRKIPFYDLFTQAMLSATVAPIVSEIAFLNAQFSPLRIVAAYGTGVFIGFIFPVVAESTKQMHGGYCLYNSGIAGGFIATFSVGLLRSLGIDILPESIWGATHSSFLAAFAFVLAAGFMAYGLIAEGPARGAGKYLRLLRETDKGDNDFLIKYGGACYINIGVMCMVSTLAVIAVGIPINGPVLGAIFTVSGFSASGKHLKNAMPILFGSMMATYLNHLDQTAPSNALAMLFATGVAPICSEHGWLWGMVAGFLHVSVAIFIGQINGGLNLYNNGFASSFLAITLVPVIMFFEQCIRKKKNSSDAGLATMDNR